MKHVFKFSMFVISMVALQGYAEVSVNVNGTHYDCSTEGGGGGNPGGGTNLCRCRSWSAGTNDTDYALEKYNPRTQQYRELQRFTRGSGADAIDRQDCLDAKEDPACYFADTASRFLQVTPIISEENEK